jgi:hypothetical protein
MSRIASTDPWSETLVAYLSQCNEMQLAGMQVPKAWKMLSPWNRIAI